MIQRDEKRPNALDSKGFLTDPALWDAHLAQRTARSLGIGELAVAHWRIIERLRTNWLEAGDLPLQRHLCRELDLTAGCIDKLFGGLIEAWKVAGLPDPGEEARVYMENMETDDTTTE
ncbi:TusE/DsrC/DsvC family sulfur relay protein [uncultured Thiohalocapsa sp.]|uniref:TusE/DsrC/DsvC family sulfur relay protein n=1 Tax=uncultured Thiohalocapsa sp. TaxID=768990 RepID=UPI0025E8DF47|nr:TusE/DsrC/DsvC family sulfur relay protein [uncultured Thiohalocapsa sp.]